MVGEGHPFRECPEGGYGDDGAIEAVEGRGELCEDFGSWEGLGELEIVGGCSCFYSHRPVFSIETILSVNLTMAVKACERYST